MKYHVATKGEQPQVWHDQEVFENDLRDLNAAYRDAGVELRIFKVVAL